MIPRVGFLWTAWVLLQGVLIAAEPVRIPLFVSGEGGYASYRIPSVTITPKGTLLVACEARSRKDSDWSQTDLLFRRSEDQGKTWSTAAKKFPTPTPLERNPVALAQKVGRAEERTLHNPVLIAARDGTIHLVFGAEYNRVFYTRSTDEGRTFESPREITAALEPIRARYDWKVVATGPGHGLELGASRTEKPRAHNGRLVIPIWLSTGTGGHGHRPSAIATLFSDNQGSSWNAGELIANDPAPLSNPSETTLAELGDGRVLLNIRSESPAHRRAVAFSPDGATGWTLPVFDDALFEPICAASLIRIPSHARERQATLLFSNPDSRPHSGDSQRPLTARRGLNIRLSADDGSTWPVQRVLDEGPSGYSDLAAGPDGSLWCFYENSPGPSLTYAALTLVRFDLDWVFGEDLRKDDAGFVPLFNGKNLDGWYNVNCAPETWTATNQVIACTGAPIGELRTTRMYQNYILELEWRHLRPKGNAGVFVWADALTARGQPFHRGVEVQVLDGLEGDWYTSDGDVFPIHGARLSPLNGRGGDRAFPVTRRMKPSPEWNHYRVTCIDGVITHAVNGAVVTRGVQASPRKGYICLESEGSPAEFRHLRIRELPAGRALAPADIAHPAEGFQNLYTGLDFRGWRMNPNLAAHWKAKDWTLEHDGKTESGDGILWTEEIHGDVQLILDWKLNTKAEAATDSQANPALVVRGDALLAIPLPLPRSGEWNRATITLRGNRLRMEIQDQTPPLEMTLDPVLPSGRIGLKPGSLPFQFANLFLRRLD